MQFSEIPSNTFPLSGGLLCGKPKEFFLLAGIVFHRGFSIVLVDGDGLRNPEQLMGLQAEPPPRVIKTVLQRQSGIDLSLGTVHRLQEKLLKIEVSKALRLGAGLGKDQFQFTTLPESKGRAGLGTDTDPIDARRRKQRAVCLNGNLKTLGVQGVNQRGIKLEQGLAACTHHKPDAASGPPGRPGSSDSLGQSAGGGETSPPGAICPNEIGITEPTDRGRAILLQPGP